MAMVINERLADQPKRPPGFPVCQGYFADKKKDPHYIRVPHPAGMFLVYRVFRFYGKICQKVLQWVGKFSKI